MPTVYSQVGATADDAHERDDTIWSDATGFSSSLAYVNVLSSYSSSLRYNAGFRFAGLALPQRAKITSAYLEIKCYWTDLDTRTLDCKCCCETNDNAVDFATNPDVTSRPRTAAGPTWYMSIASAAQPWITSPNLAPAVQAVVDRPGWSSGNALVVFLDGRNISYYPLRICDFFAHDGNPAYAAKLTITWEWEAKTGPAGSTVSAAAVVTTVGSELTDTPGGLAVGMPPVTVVKQVDVSAGIGGVVLAAPWAPSHDLALEPAAAVFGGPVPDVNLDVLILAKPLAAVLSGPAPTLDITATAKQTTAGLVYGGPPATGSHGADFAAGLIGGVWAQGSSFAWRPLYAGTVGAVLSGPAPGLVASTEMSAGLAAMVWGPAGADGSQQVDVSAGLVGGVQAGRLAMIDAAATVGGGLVASVLAGPTCSTPGGGLLNAGPGSAVSAALEPIVTPGAVAILDPASTVSAAGDGVISAGVEMTGGLVSATVSATEAPIDVGSVVIDRPAGVVLSGPVTVVEACAAYTMNPAVAGAVLAGPGLGLVIGSDVIDPPAAATVSAASDPHAAGATISAAVPAAVLFGPVESITAGAVESAGPGAMVSAALEPIVTPGAVAILDPASTFSAAAPGLVSGGVVISADLVASTFSAAGTSNVSVGGSVIDPPAAATFSAAVDAVVVGSDVIDPPAASTVSAAGSAVAVGADVIDPPAASTISASLDAVGGATVSAAAAGSVVGCFVLVVGAVHLDGAIGLLYELPDERAWYELPESRAWYTLPDERAWYELPESRAWYTLPDDRAWSTVID